MQQTKDRAFYNGSALLRFCSFLLNSVAVLMSRIEMRDHPIHHFNFQFQHSKAVYNASYSNSLCSLFVIYSVSDY